MSKPRRLVIASGNQGKIREFQGLLSSLSLEVVAQPDGIDVEETGSTFAANARIKAEAVAKRTGHWALADDSGLSVDALDGAPGVHSARRPNCLQTADALEGNGNRVFPLPCAHGRGNVLVEVEGVAAITAAVAIEATTRSSRWPAPCPRKCLAERNGHRGRAFALLEPRLTQLLTTT